MLRTVYVPLERDIPLWNVQKQSVFSESNFILWKYSYDWGSVCSFADEYSVGSALHYLVPAIHCSHPKDKLTNFVTQREHHWHVNMLNQGPPPEYWSLCSQYNCPADGRKLAHKIVRVTWILIVAVEGIQTFWDRVSEINCESVVYRRKQKGKT